MIDLELMTYSGIAPPNFQSVEDEVAMDILQYWKKWETSLPILGHVARKVLSTYCSSRDPERLFSRARFVIGTLRGSLAPDRIER